MVSMLDPALEAQLLRQAVDAGLLSEQALRDLDVGRATAGPADASEFGARIDHLVQIGKLRKEDMAALLASMRAATTAKTMNAEQDLALVQTLDGASAVPREPQVSIRFPVHNWARYELLGLLAEVSMRRPAPDRRLCVGYVAPEHRAEPHTKGAGRDEAYSISGIGCPQRPHCRRGMRRSRARALAGGDCQFAGSGGAIDAERGQKGRLAKKPTRTSSEAKNP